MKSRYIIGSRGSRLAVWQAEWAKATLESAHPELTFTIEIITTSGDTLKDAPLAIIGGKGVFIKEIEEALLGNRIDLAVHSLKDMPTSLPDKLMLGAITEREDPRDALVLRADLEMESPSLSRLSDEAVVGTSSPRRFAQLKHLYPNRVVKDLRGNVDTRLRKLDAGWYDALILAAAGLTRLGLSDRISAYLDPAEMLPAVGQGALGIETRNDDEDIVSVVQPLNHPQTAAACTSERALLRGLGGGCQLPIAGYATLIQNDLQIDGLVSSINGETVVRATTTGMISEAEHLGERLAQRLIAGGADALLDL